MRLKTVKRLWRILRSKPFIDISRYGWKTDRPRVGVGVNSRHGMHSLFDFADDDAGNAGAELAARSLGHITSFPVFDRRPQQQG